MKSLLSLLLVLGLSGAALGQSSAADAAAGLDPTFGPYDATPVDLNGDRATDYILRASGPGACGAQNCPFYVMVAERGGFRQIYDGLAAAIAPTQGSSHGFVSLRANWFSPLNPKARQGWVGAVMRYDPATGYAGGGFQ